VQKTYYPKPNELTNEWLLIDAEGQNLGRLATKLSSLLLGKNKTEFTPGVDVGDYVVVINAEKIAVTGNRLDQKFYYRYSGYPGGMKKISLREQLEKRPDRVIRAAVWGMIPHNRYGRKIIKRLKVFAGPEHHHQAQKPTKIEL
jgi:large subunit ribosomal protein L13